MKYKNNIVFAGGGSGGHVAPIRAIAPLLRNDSNFSGYYWIGMASFERQAAADNGISFIKIRTGKLRRYFDWRNFTDVALTSVAFVRCMIILLRLKPRMVFASGGFVSVPVVIAAWLLRVPAVVIHEQTMAFGLANKIGSIFATKILLGFPESLKHLPPDRRQKAVVVGNPLNPLLLRTTPLDKYLTISSKVTKVIYVTGGSQGAVVINKAVWAILAQAVDAGWCIIHQCGKHGIEAATPLKHKFPGFYFPAAYFSDELPAIFQSVDLVVSRSGSGTVNELSFFELPAIFVPLEPNSNDEQKLNALNYAKKYPAIVVKQGDLTPASLWEAISSLPMPKRSTAWQSKTDETARKIVDELV